MVDMFGGWQMLQELVAVLENIAARHNTSASVIALRQVLDQPGVSALLLGASSPANISGNLQVFDISLTSEDRQELSAALARMTPPGGGPGELERDPNSIFGTLIEASRLSNS
jgi:aryl-alcohol dehydrogenase-like predicted oxidoreductase